MPVEYDGAKYQKHRSCLNFAVVYAVMHLPQLTNILLGYIIFRYFYEMDLF